MASTKRIEGKKGASWRVMWRDSQGKQRARNWKSAREARAYESWRTLHPSASEADWDALTAPQPALQLQRGSGGVTVADMFAAYTGARVVSRHRAAAESAVFRSQLAPLHNTPVRALLPIDVRSWLANMQRATKPGGQPYAPATISAALNLLRRILDAAVENGQLASNPAARVNAPKVQAAGLTESDVLSPGELALVLTHIPRRWVALFALLGYTGARLSEALGLTTDQLDMRAGTVTLGTRVAEEVGGLVQIRHSPKTAAGRRTVPLPAPAMAALAAHLAHYQPAPGAPLFATESGAIPVRSNLRQRFWQPALKAAGVARAIPLRNLRHTAATHMLAVMPPLAVAARLGHANPAVTLRTYARFIADESAEARATAALDAYLAASAELAASVI